MDRFLFLLRPVDRERDPEMVKGYAIVAVSHEQARSLAASVFPDENDKWFSQEHSICEKVGLATALWLDVGVILEART